MDERRLSLKEVVEEVLFALTVGGLSQRNVAA